MQENRNSETLEYNTERETLSMPEYGRNVLKMVTQLKTIEDRQKRSEQAAAIVKVMEILNPQVRSQEAYRHKLWDQLYMIAGFDLDVDSPFPKPVEEEFETKPVPLPMKGTRIKATHYGRNIEKMIDLVCEEENPEMKTALIKALATYMRQQYLIWNKDFVEDETIFADLEKLAEGQIKVPEGLTLSKIAPDVNYSRPGGNQQGGKNRNRKAFKKNRK